MQTIEPDRISSWPGRVLGKCLLAGLLWVSLWGCASLPQGALQRQPQAGGQLPETETLQAFVQRQGGEYHNR